MATAKPPRTKALPPLENGDHLLSLRQPLLTDRSEAVITLPVTPTA